MSTSIYHFFCDLYKRRGYLRREGIKPEDFTFDESLLSLKQSKGGFPDLAIRIDTTDSPFTGGELIEIKDSGSYSVASFNSTLPQGVKKIADVTSQTGKIYKKMEESGDQVFSLEERDVYYLVRGRRESKGHVKVCLVHGSFFETIPANTHLKSAFEKVLDEAIEENRQTENSFLREAKTALLKLFWKREFFSKGKKVKNASVSIRFRVMSEVKKEGNILDSKYYPQISDNTLNLVIPIQGEDGLMERKDLLQEAFGTPFPEDISSFVMKHPLNGHYAVFQCPIPDSSQ